MLIIVGPTASGKTGLSVELAKQRNGEIVSADSMQIYRHMDIGTAKPSMEERQGIVHHLMDVVEPWESFTVAQYRRLAVEAIDDIASRGKLPIVVGGTGLYVNSLIRGWSFSNTPPSETVRKEIQTFYEEKGRDRLYEELSKVDPESAEKIHPNNIKRVIRALEVFLETGKKKSLSDAQSTDLPIPFDHTLVGLTMGRDRLYRRIEERIDIMIQQGLLQEVRQLVEMGADRNWQSMQGLGYKEILAYLDGESTWDEALYLLKRDTRRYAKRQWTWFRRLEEIHWIDMDALVDPEEAMVQIVEYMNKKD
ncbi:tRNA (adenosine(37)-N6)-dimethylallyltransferase MiaA [Alkalibacter rhizosphaerae]|uniref:tRNA dimethylallyltransferase n=1 Tax=Alkalibacter rhizosphaerae TaxID=2815577 RepID=A0A974XGV8_9FIRM|nr:tRNA (adenosine(37)-N6)-dimethylallyltransferase MiaA [Alkalibacter rhizosphaerae]